MSNLMPQRKVGAPALAGALATMIVWSLNVLAGIEVPGVESAALTTILMFVIGYFIKNGGQ